MPSMTIGRNLSTVPNGDIFEVAWMAIRGGLAHTDIAKAQW